MIFGYARVSSKEQNEDRQIKALVEFGVDKKNILVDKASGKDFDRVSYSNLKENILRPGDVLVIKELDRLGRNKEQVKKELDYFKENKIRIKILNIPTTLVDLPEGQEWGFEMINNILIELLGAIAEEERNKIKVRQAEGIKALKDRNGGKGIGRPKTQLNKEQRNILNLWAKGEIKGVQAQKLMNVKKGTFYNLVKEFNIKKEGVK